ncbi:ATP-binding response regulator [Motilimonas pumila]|nr:response regulator [Motilimonas pumila]
MLEDFTAVNKFAKLSALVVDDYPVMNKAVTSMLTSLGFAQVYRASHGKEALLLLEEHSVDLIVSDWNMPKMNGFELLQHVRESSQAHQNVPFIMLTGNVNHDDVKQAIATGVSEYLVKPFNHNTLKAKVDNAFAMPVRVHKPAQQVPLTDAKTTTNSPDEDVASTPAVPQSSSKPSILIVDDQANNITVLTELLKQQYQLKACLTGAKALTICQSDNPPDLILLDIMMPDMDGLEVCQRLQGDPQTQYIPIIFITALTQTKDVVKGLSLGAVDYITKPIEPEVTLARIATHMKLVQHRLDMAAQLDTLLENARLKDEIERIVQHDVKSPLSAIYAATQAIEQKQSDCQIETDIIKSSASTIEQMIENHMLLHQLEQGSPFTLGPLNAVKVIRTALFGLKQFCQQQQLRIVSDIKSDLTFKGEQRLAQNMFYNLINNAVQAAPKGSQVTLTGQWVDNQVEFSIHNLGAIPAQIRGNFFDKFTTHGKSGGSGIGTYSAKLAAQAQQGSIDFSSDEQQGTRLTVRLLCP